MGVHKWWMQLLLGCLVGLLPGCALSRVGSSPTASALLESGQTLAQTGIVTIERIPGKDGEPIPSAREQGDPQATSSANGAPLSREADLARRFPGKQVVFPGDLPPRGTTRQAYVVGVEDVLKISVWQNPDLTTEVMVRPDGGISLPPVGEVEAAGVPLGELQAKLTKLFAEFVQNPRVTAVPVQMNSRKVFFAGRVRSPSTVVLKRNQSLLETITEVGILDDADMSEAYTIRGNLIILVDLAKLLDGDLSQDLSLEPWDKVVIPALEKEVFVLGEVARPGKLKLQRRARLMDAISLAGGPTEKAHLLGAYLVRAGEYLPLDMERVLRGGELNGNLPLERGDLIFFPSIDENKVFVLGEVNTPGPVRSAKPLNLIEALGAAGGFNIFAAKESVRIVRGNPKDPLVMRVNMEEVLKGHHLDQVRLARGDIVYVPPSWLASWNRFVSQILPGITSVLAVQAVGALAR